MEQEIQFRPKKMIVRGDAFIIGVERYIALEGEWSISGQLNEARYTISEADITYRVASHWASVGLIDDTRPEGKGWRKFSALDLVWLKIVTELRLFGLALDKLVKVKQSLDSLFADQTTPERKAWGLEYYTALALVQRVPVYVLVFRDGTAELATEEQYRLTSELFALAHHIESP